MMRARKGVNGTRDREKKQQTQRPDTYTLNNKPKIIPSELSAKPVSERLYSTAVVCLQPQCHRDRCPAACIDVPRMSVLNVGLCR